MKKSLQKNYGESSIKVLKGLEPVQQRPGMYTRTENPLHVIQEVIDNATDEALGRFGQVLDVTLHADYSMTIEDEGRGIPFGMHPEEKVSVLEIVFTRLHAGGKFNKTQNDGAYDFSGGLHGVGVSVTNALSKRLEVTVWREGKRAQMAFSGGKVVESLQVSSVKKNDKQSGTRVSVWPDARYFDQMHFPIESLRRLLRSKAVLLPGIKVTLNNEVNHESQTWQYQDGLRGYLAEGLAGSELLGPIFEAQRYLEEADGVFAEGEGVSFAMAWGESGALLRESYVNLIPTPAGGTHELGLREGVFQAMKNFIELHSLLPKGVKLLAEDVFSRVSFVLSAKVLDPQFQGQIKERLNNRDALKLISNIARPALELWLNQHVTDAKKIAEWVIKQAQARARAGQKIEKRKSSGVAVLPGKLTDCESQDIRRNELFLVEGDSAGGSAKMGRDKGYQAILPLRGKVLNTWETEPARLFANNEVHDISVAIGVDPHTVNDVVNLQNLRYGKICILSDADVDGAHIQVLLLTLFFKHFPKLVAHGHVYIAQPPLFRVDLPARGKRPAQKIYALDEQEYQSMTEKLRKEGLKEEQWSVSRFKGLGEMSAEQLWETTMNPDTRRLMPVNLGNLDFDSTVQKMTMLMGKGEAAARRVWLEEKGNQVKVDI